MVRSSVILGVLSCGLAGCNPVSDAEVGDQAPQKVVVATAVSSPAIVEIPGKFLSRDCATVAGAYSEALGEKKYLLAAQTWADPIGSGTLEMRYQDYGKPALQIGEAREAGAAGSLYCEVTVTLRDGANLQAPLTQGTITFRRVNDVPGASTEQLRWRITKSTIDEGIGRVGGSPSI